ncbi:MAG: metallophosphoesterase [Gemmatimonadota bacterium]|nr:metallophosphoesterase [Gemmatimonadota bacterium]
MIPRVLILSFAMLAVAVPARAQANAPYQVFDTRPVITEGPYLVATSETTATIVWLTDTPSHAKVRYGLGSELSSVAEPQVDGLVPVGTRHVVHLTNLSPGTTYSYEAVATRVVKLKAYWPDKGLDVRSGPYQFTTFDRNRPLVSFSVVTDTHEDTGRIDRLNQAIDWEATEFLVHAGDAFHWIDTEDHLFRAWLRPTTAGLAHTKSLIFVRGNHELRGPFARRLLDYVPTPEGRFYYARDAGPVHLMVLDTGEDKPDDTNVYAELNRTVQYRADELAWLRDHVETARVAEAPFRVILMHQPQWGWLADGSDAWTGTANAAGVDLVIAGHRHRFSYTPPDLEHSYHLLVVDQDQVARVDATAAELKVVVTGLDGSVVHTLVIARRAMDGGSPR